MMAVDFDEIARSITPDQLASAIGAEKVGRSWRCPNGDAHANGDRNPSFSIFRDGNRSAAKCYGCGLGGSPVAVAARVWGVEMPEAARQLVEKGYVSVPSRNGRGDGFEVMAEYDYRDEAGKLLSQALRLYPKDFLQRRPDGHGKWIWNVKGVRRVPYRLPELLEKVAADNLVVVVEGEKDADRLAKLGVCATTNAGGAGKWTSGLSEHFRGARVAILPDNDPSGHEHADKVARSLHGVADQVKVVELPDLAEKGDVSDWLDAGGTVEELARLVEDAPVWTSAPAEDEDQAPDEANRPSLTDTDTGNAARLVARHQGWIRYIPAWGRWIVWDAEQLGRWVIDHRDVHVRELAKDVGYDLQLAATEEPDYATATKLFSFARRSLNARGITGMVDLARGVEDVPLDHEELDADGWLLGVGNGVVDLRTGEFRPPDPDDLITMQAPVCWEPEAKCPRWEQALEEWFPDPQVRAYVHRLAGAALVGEQRDHMLVIHYGLGGNGKGTFAGTLQAVLGPYAVEVHLSLLVQTRYKEHDTVKADLFRTRLAVAVETERRVKLAEANVKNLTGGDRIRARRMREDPWSFDPSHSLWLQTNHLPEISGRDAGIWRRMCVVKWEKSFTGKAADSELRAKLADEAPGILRWLVEGCLAWQREGLAEPEAVVRETLAYREKEDVLSRFARDNGLVFDPKLRIQAKRLQELLTEWADEEGMTAPRSEVGEWLHEQECRQTRERWTDATGKRRQARFWLGVGIPDYEDSENPQAEAFE